jgi:hypothetical protein
MKQAAAFALLLLVVLLSPLLAGKKFVPPRREVYSSVWWASGEFPYFYQQLFQEKGNLDIVFLGASHIHTAFDTPYVQEQLTQRLGRPAAARTFGWGWPGYDQLYFFTRDLLAHRRVRMLVFDDLYKTTDAPHPLSPRMFRFGDDAEALRGLSPVFKGSYYLAALAGMPRNLLSLVRTNLPADVVSDQKNFYELHDRAPNPATRLGTLTEQLGFSPNYLADYPDHQPFVAYTPERGVQPSDVCLYSEATKTNFAFGGGLPPMQLHFVQAFAALAREHGCKLVMVHVPFYDERRSAVVSEPVFWPAALGVDVAMVGIPPATLFRGLSDAEVLKLYSDPVHLNQNGQRYLTTLMTPTLLQIYESQTRL